MSDLRDLGFDPKTLYRGDQPTGDSAYPAQQTEFRGTTSIANPITESKPASAITSESFADVFYSGKTSFTDTAQGFRMGLDSGDHLYKWVIGSSFATMDFGVTSPGVFYINLPTVGAASNAIFINDASNSTYSAVDIRRSVGTGAGLGAISSAGPCVYLTQNSDTSTIYAEGSVLTSGNGGIIEGRGLVNTTGPVILGGAYGAGDAVVGYVDSTATAAATPFRAEQYKATTTNYYRVVEYNGAAIVGTNVWIANNVTPDAILTGAKGDLCQSSNGNVYVNTNDSTTWSTLLTSGGAGFPVVDTTEIINGSADATKRIRFEVDGLTTATTRVLTVPDASGTMTLLGNASTGSGSVVLATTPTITTPNVTGDITCTGTFISSDITGVQLNPYGTDVGNTGAIAFLELAANGTNYIAFKAADAITTSTTYVLPSAAGSAGSVLTDAAGDGTLSWATGNSVNSFDFLWSTDFDDVGVSNRWVAFTAGGAADTVAAAGARLLADASGDYSYIYGDMAPQGAFAPYGNNPSFCFMVRITNLVGSNAAGYVGLGNIQSTAASADGGLFASTIHMGVKFAVASAAMSITPTQGDGSGATTGTALTGLAIGDEIEIKIVVTSGTNAKYYYRKNGSGAMTLLATVTGDLPSGAAVGRWSLTCTSANSASTLEYSISGITYWR